MDIYFPRPYKKVIKEAHNKETFTFETEASHFGMSHGEVGAYILDKWKFPKPIVEAVRWHHWPDRAPQEYRLAAQVVHLSDTACAAVGGLEPGEERQTSFNQSAWYDLGLVTEDIETIINELTQELQKSNMFFGLDS